MWGQISTEASYQYNFNTTFSTTRSDVLVHLAQWQYWWWFWFAFVWSLYYFIFLRIFRYRSLKMRPKIVTSFRPHGKWGDFLAAIIPTLWCLNILTNSNFILRLIEWQNESSLFTIRVRARQWYWVYKYELKTFTDVLSAPKNVGSNKWVLNFFGDLETSDDYLHVLQLRRNNKWVKNYWSTLVQKLSDTKNINSYYSFEKVNESKNFRQFNQNFSLFTVKSIDFFNFKPISYNYFGFFKNSLINDFSVNSIFFFFNFSDSNFFNFGFKNFSINSIFYSFFSGFSKNYSVSNRFFSDFSEISRFVKKTQGVKLPFRLVKNFLSMENDLFQNEFFFKNSFGSGVSSLEEKNFSNSYFLVLKQKKYTRKDDIRPVTYDAEANGKAIKYTGRSILLNNSIFDEYLNDSNIAYRLLKKNKKRTEMIPTTLAKRILRTKRTMILPAHTNITLITNSFDIVHSWYIPGLGIKLDCVPGRSTHHTFYVDNVGFYFGQCAEICGRYHHHMPIRLCALPFEHFLVWWNVFGLSKLATINKKNYQKFLFVNSKYVW